MLRIWTWADAEWAKVDRYPGITRLIWNNLHIYSRLDLHDLNASALDGVQQNFTADVDLYFFGQCNSPILRANPKSSARLTKAAIPECLPARHSRMPLSGTQGRQRRGFPTEASGNDGPCAMHGLKPGLPTSLCEGAPLAFGNHGLCARRWIFLRLRWIVLGP